MLIPLELFRGILAMAYWVYPEEACGLLAENESRDIAMVYHLTNELHSKKAYSIDAVEQFRAIRHAERNGWRIAGAFHSHVRGEAYPSATDIRMATDPGLVHLIVGLRDYLNPVIRGFRIRDGLVKEEPIETCSVPV